MNKKLVLTILSSFFLLYGCNHKAKSHQKINPEILGVWQDSSGCKLKLGLLNDTLILESFSNANNVNLNNINLDWSKQSVFTVFTSTESNIKFSGSFSDGLMTIGDKLCAQPLYKVDVH